MIQRVYEQAIQAQLLSEIIVATDDQRIYDVVSDFGGKVMMTATTIPSGTERAAAVARHMDTYSHFINIQGDEPYIDPRQIDQVAALLKNDQSIEIATLVKRIQDYDTLKDPKYAKVVISNDGYATYFSRAAIPHCFNVQAFEEWVNTYPYYKHISIYGFQRDILLKIPDMPEVLAEKAESLEQLRWIGNGYRVKVGITPHETVSIDTPQDLNKLQQFKKY